MVMYTKEGMEKRRKKFLSSFINKSKDAYGSRYIYDLVTISDFERKDKKASVFCRIHGIFMTIRSDHIRGRANCPACAITTKNRKLLKGKKLVKGTKQFIKEAVAIHGDLYDYSKVDYKRNNEKVSIICRIHGVFRTVPGSHLSMRTGCPKCSASKGESAIERYLKSKGILYIQEFSVGDLKTVHNRSLRFDFYLPDHGVIVEFDGDQHHIALPFFGGEEGLKRVQHRDTLKNTYCKRAGIKMIRIRYNKLNKINEYMEKVLETSNDTWKALSVVKNGVSGFMTTTRAMEVPGVGCIIQVTTQQGGNVAEAVTFVPGVKLKENKDESGKVVSRELVGKNI